jgi:hypothetical protein
MAVFADPLDLFGAMNPVPDERALPATSAYVPAQRTLQRILAQSLPLAPSAPAPDPGAAGAEDGGDGGGRRRRPSKRLVVGVAVATIGLVAAAAAWVVTRPAGNPTQVACFASADLQADTAALAAGLGDPVAACEEVWRTGPFQAWGAVPPLAACVLESGVAGVFPGDPSVCDRLGLPRLATESGDWNARVTQLVDGLTAELASPSCVDVGVAADLVRQQLDQLALHGWTLIAPATAVPERPCASVAFDPPARTVTLVPVPLPGD